MNQIELNLIYLAIYSVREFVQGELVIQQLNKSRKHYLFQGGQ